MPKYDALGPFLQGQGREQVLMTFAEIEGVIGARLPNSKRYPAWWSNNSGNNVMTKVWLAAGFRTEQVDIAGEKLVFRRAAPPGMQDAARISEGPMKANAKPGISLFGALKGTFTIEPGWDLTNPAFDDADLKALDANVGRTADLIDQGLRAR